MRINGTRRRAGWLLLALASGLMAFLPRPSAAQEAKPWSEKETQLATQYLSLLVKQPEPGRVLDLLWELYDKRGQTDFLLQSIANQVKQRENPATRLIHGHLLRKAGKPEDAKSSYQRALELQPEPVQQAIAFRSLAELAREAGQKSEALDWFDRLLKAMPAEDPQRPRSLIELGRFALDAGKVDEAAAAWEEAARLKPKDTALAVEVAQLLVGTGFTAKALAIYQKIAQESDPTKKLDALYHLSRLTEQADHFDESVKALRDGLALLHFKDWRYAQFFQRLVKLHERFGRLDELKSTLAKAASAKPPQEQALADMARFSQLTVDADEYVKWLRELTRAFPETQEYRWELVAVLLDHEGASEAAKLLDEVLKNDGTDLAALVLLRCEAHLRVGETAAAVQRLKMVLEAQGSAADVEKQVLAFAQERSLDAIVEQALRARIARDPHKAEPVFELASFLTKRKRDADAEKLLDDYVHQSGLRKDGDRQRRLRAVATFYASTQETEVAEKAARQAVATKGAGREDYLQLADVLLQRGEPVQALELLEHAWTLAVNVEERTDVDERILALLAGEDGLAKPMTSPEPGSEFKLPAIFTGEGFGSEGPAQKRNEVPDAVRDYALAQAMQVSGLRSHVSRIRSPMLEWVRAVVAELAAPWPEPSPERVLRAAWWCFRANQWQLAYDLLAQLHFDENGQWVNASVDAEKLLLDLALADHNVLLAIRQLGLLATIDPGNRTTYLLRLADQEGHRSSFVASYEEVRWQEEIRGQHSRAVPVRTSELSSPQRGYHEAVRTLEGLVKEDPQNESVLSALSQFYIEGGKRDAALGLWERAAANAKGNAAPLLERYAELLLAQRKHKEFVEVQMRIITEEPDVKRRRETFARMLERLLWADVVQSNTLPDDELKKRLDLILNVLQERSRREPFEGFWHEALAAVYDKQGDAAKAFAEMKQAYYTAPETPYSLDQLRGAALKVGDKKSAIYFQKQIAASAAPKDEAAEWRQLVTLLEQDFRMVEADQVRRRMEARFSQDPAALDELARYYGETGQDDAARRVQEQLARVRSWDAKNLLRLALQQRRIGNDTAARTTLSQLLTSSQPPAAAANLPPERQPWPLLDDRKPQAFAPSALLTALDNTPGLEQKERDRLRGFLSLPRNEFVEVPDDAAHVRLRAVEELAELMAGAGREKAGSLLSETPAGKAWTLTPMERAWMLFYSGDDAGFRGILRERFANTDSLEARFLFAWLNVKAHGMTELIAWARDTKASDAKRATRRGMIQAVLHMLADDASFEYTEGDIQVLGAAMLFSNVEIYDIASKLSSRQRHDLAVTLTAAAQRNSPALVAEYAVQLARFAEAAGRPDLERIYLRQAWEKPLKAGLPNVLDVFAQCTAKLYRLAETPEEREQLLRQSWARLRQLPPSGLGALREARLLGLAGAQAACEERLAEYFGNGFLTAHKFIEPLLGGKLPAGMPSPGPRIDEQNHLHAYWENLRDSSNILQEEGLGPALLAVDRAIMERNGGVPLGPKSNYDFSAWRNHMLKRQLRFSNYPQRLRILRQFLEADDSVETLIELGAYLEGQGRMRDCVEIYRRLPERAFANVEYCEQFLRVCESSWECNVAIPYIERLFGAEPQFRPLNLPENLLEEKHALFLARLQDVVRLQLGAFRAKPNVRTLPGREPAEVPYLRELGLLLERTGDKAGALNAWEELCKVWPQDEEAGLHRARLLLDQGNKTRALDAVRAVDMANLYNEPVREAVELRVQLAADAGQWDEVREVMNTVCGGTKLSATPHTGTVINLAGILARHQRTAEAQGLLVRAERAVKDPNDRFRLRLEQIKLLAREPAWQPTDVARIAALTRLETNDQDSLQSWLDFLKQESAGSRARSWVETLSSVPAGPIASLGLCAFASQLDDRKASLIPQPWLKADNEGTPAQRMATEELLRHQKAAWAHAVAISGRGRALRDSPAMVRVLHALGNRHALDELFAALVRERAPGGNDVVGFCDALADTGRADLAMALCETALKQQRGVCASYMPLVHRYVRLLIDQRQFEKAEILIMQEDDALTVETASILVDLYRSWNKLDRLPQELAKFHLPDGMRAETEFLAKSVK